MKIDLSRSLLLSPNAKSVKTVNKNSLSFQSETYQEDIYPMTPGTEPALSADEWLSGINRGKDLHLFSE